MKVSLRFLAISSLSLGLLLVFSLPAQAKGPIYEETYHIGLTAGNIDGGTEFGSVPATGFVLAARNKKASLEYFNLSSDQGDVLSTGDQWEAKLSGFYLSLIGQGQPYMKFRVGKLKHEMVTSSGSTPTSETGSITSYGLGVGYKLGSRTMIEFDITSLDQDMTLFSISVLF